MKLNKRQTYFAILAIWFFLCLLYQSVWIFSRTATAEIYAVKTNTIRRSAGGGISWMQASYKVGDKIYYDSYLKDGYDISNRYFKIRYLIFAPDISRADTFVSNWGPLIMFFVLMTLVTSIVFIRKDIISDRVVIVIQTKRPFF